MDNVINATVDTFHFDKDFDSGQMIDKLVKYETKDLQLFKKKNA